MKAFSIQQPYASLICSGVKDVENRKWALKNTPITVLIHAGARRLPETEDNLPYFLWWPVDNAQKDGALCPLKEAPTSAIVGIATIDRCETDNESIWAGRGPGAEYQWVMRDAKLFKEPILGVKGKLGIFDIPEIDESNLPPFVEIPKTTREGTTLRMPLKPEAFKAISESDDEETVTRHLTDDNWELFADENLKPLPTDKVVFVCDGKELERKVVDYGIIEMYDKETNEAITEEDIFGRVYGWYKVLLAVKK